MGKINHRTNTDPIEIDVKTPSSISVTMPSYQLVDFNELSNHRSTDTGVWVAIDGNVYDVTSFLEEHPGGADILLDEAGKDITEDFFDLLGKLSVQPESAVAPVTKNEEEAALFRSETWHEVSVSMRLEVSHDTRIFNLKWNGNGQFRLPCGKHILLRHRDQATGVGIIRSYTPILVNNQAQEIVLLIKVYKKDGANLSGKMTTAVDAMPIGSTLEMKGPVGKFEYLRFGDCLLSGKCFRVKRFIMISGGSGITPMLQILKSIDADTDDLTECLLLNSNRDEEDILCRDMLDAIASQNKDRIRIVETLSRPSLSWKGLRGRINRSMLEAEIGRSKSNGEEVVLLCGPPAMELAVKEMLLSMDWKLDDIIQF